MLIFLIKLLIVLLSVVVILGMVRTWQMETSRNQILFAGGKAPEIALDGFYNGLVEGLEISWMGKKFDAATQTGINVFDDGNGVQEERYPFKTAFAKGIEDKHTDVITIDYNIPTNPFWLRPIIDEIVEVAPDTYLGKLHVRLIPGYPFTVSYFELSK